MSTHGVVVVGSAVVDTAFHVPALPFPGETAVASASRSSPGGKGANQAAAARRLGAPTLFVGRVGDDEGGRLTRSDLEAFGVDLHLTVTPGVVTGHAAVFVDEEGENLIAVHPGANAHLAPADVDAVADVIRQAAVLVTQLEVPIETVRHAAELAARADVRTVLNAAPAQEGAEGIGELFDVLVVNRQEAERLTGVGVTTLDDAMAALRGLRDMGCPDPVVTLGAAGAVCFDHGRAVHAAAPRVEAVDGTGAGDAFVGALAALLREGVEWVDAVRDACAYAALAVTKPGTRASFADRAAFDAAVAERAR
jgi:ribokinase